jgi:hypothetical protein
MACELLASKFIAASHSCSACVANDRPAQTIEGGFATTNALLRLLLCVFMLVGLSVLLRSNGSRHIKLNGCAHSCLGCLPCAVGAVQVCRAQASSTCWHNSGG